MARQPTILGQLATRSVDRLFRSGQRRCASREVATRIGTPYGGHQLLDELLGIGGQKSLRIPGDDCPSPASETTGTAVFRIVVSSDSMKNATATSQGNSCLLAADGGGGGASVSMVVRVPSIPPHGPWRAAYCGQTVLARTPGQPPPGLSSEARFKRPVAACPLGP